MHLVRLKTGGSNMPLASVRKLTKKAGHHRELVERLLAFDRDVAMPHKPSTLLNLEHGENLKNLYGRT